MGGRIVFLNALPLNAFPMERFCLRVERVDLNNAIAYLRALVKGGYTIANYIRHPSTVALVNRLFNLKLAPSNALYQYQYEDVLIIVSLKRPVRGAEIENLSAADLDIFVVDVGYCG